MNIALRRCLQIDAADPVQGGSIHRCFRVVIAGESRFLKTNDATWSTAFAAEADGLVALRFAGMRTPVVTGHGIAGGEAYLLLEFLDLERHGDFAALGRMLAEAHRKPRPRFGFTQDNYIGTTRQQNGWSENWAEFWRQRRMKPQLELAGKNGFDLGEVGLDGMLERHEPQASLLHGDLWSGNVGFTADGPVVFDPAVYYGDREADVAMTELFGGFPREFYASYDEAFPLDPGYEKRKHLYNLYHLLNHLNLFGGAYLAQVKSTLSLLGLQ